MLGYRLIAFGAKLWRIIGWIWGTVIIGGFFAGLIISYMMTGTSGLQNSDPRSWFIVRPFLAHPLTSAISLFVALLLTLGCYFAAHLEKRNQEEQRNAHEEALVDVAKGVRKLLEEANNPRLAAIGVPYFENSVSRYTFTPDIFERLVELQMEAENSLLICREFNPLIKLEVWNSVRNAWWFDDSYLGEKIDKIGEFFHIVEEYSHLPRKRGDGYKIENWVRNSNIEVKYLEAKAQFDTILGNI